MRRRTVDERYQDSVRRQRRVLLDFAEHEIEWAGLLIKLYKCKKIEMPDDEYRGCAFFLNKEYKRKPGSLTLLYVMCNRCYRELPEYSKENGFDLLRFRFKTYAVTLEKGGY